METANVTLGLSFLAGLASFLSPCVFSLVPAYISYLGGRSAGIARGGQINRWVTLLHGFAFVLGFSMIFVLMGLAASAIGGLLYDLQIYLAKIGGLIVIIFGLHMIGIFRIPLLEYDTRRQEAPDPRFGYFSSFLMGVFFSAGWSPCVGPTLGLILTLSFTGGSMLQGVVLLSAYSAGLAIPFLIAALGIGWVTAIIRKYGKVMRYIEIGMGIILVIVGVMLLLGTFEQLSKFGLFFDFGI